MRAECVIVVPSLKKAAFVFGGEYGKGLMSCTHGGQWGAPIFMQIGKGTAKQGDAGRGGVGGRGSGRPRCARRNRRPDEGGSEWLMAEWLIADG
jgi:hypothetical protein